MKKGYILKAIVTVLLFYMTMQAVIIPVYSWSDNGTISNPSILYGDPLFEVTDSFNCEYGYFYVLLLYDEMLDAPYGLKYEYSTSPNAQLSAYVMDYEDTETYVMSAGLTNRGKTLEDEKSSGKGSFRFTENDYWFLIIENLDDDTTFSFTLSIEKIAPIGLIIGLSVGGVVVIGIVVAVVVTVRKKKGASGYVPPAASTYSGYSSTSSASPYGASTTPTYATPIAAPTDNVQELFNSANSEFQQGNVVQAMNLWEQILVSSPDFYPAMCNLAVAHMSLGNTSRAVEYLNQALGIKPDYKPALDLLEIAKSKQDEVAKG